MKSYKYCLDLEILEKIRTKIEKLVEPDCVITPKSLGKEWKKTRDIDQDPDKLKEQYELILNCTERLRSREGVVAISPGFKTTYFCSFLKAAYKMKLAGHDPQAGNDSFFDIIYDYEQGIIALAYNDTQNPNGHDGLADRMGIPTGDSREQYMVGGGIKFDGKKLVTSEHSGHYGHLWTDKLRQEVCELISAATGLAVEHRVWGKTVTFSSEKPAEKAHLHSCVTSYQAGFFNTQKPGNHSIMSPEHNTAPGMCVLL